MAKIEGFVCPSDMGSLIQDLENGTVKCSVCSKAYSIVHGIPSFIDPPSGEDSFSSKTFSLEWTYFSFADFKKLGEERNDEKNTLDKRWENFDYEGSFFETTGLTKEELKGKKNSGGWRG